MRIVLLQEMTPDDLASVINEGADNTEELYELIIALDAGGADWGLTERLFEYFQTEMERLAAEKDQDGESL